MIFLSKLTRSKESKRFILLLCFVSLTLFTVAQTGTGLINNGAKMIINSGAIMKIQGTGADYTNNTDGTHGRIDLDGKIEIEGDWTNNATSGNVLINVDTDGEVIFNGSSTQNIAGSATSGFEKLTINNSSGLSLSADAEVENVLTLTSSLVTLNINNIIIGTTGSLSGTFSSSNMFITNSTGTLRKSFASTGSFTFPIGENTVTTEYSPVAFTLTGHDGLLNAWVSAHVTDAKHSSNTSPSEFLSRYWTLSSSGITAPNYDADFNYLTADINGTEANIYAAEYNGGRTVYLAVNAAGNILPVTGLSSFADYTGVDGTVPTTVISTTEPDDPTNTNPIPFTITFSEEVTGFTYTDITIDNGSTSSISTLDYIEFTFDIITDKDSIITIDVNADVAKDIAGNDNTAAITYRIEYDGADPYISSVNPTDNHPGVALNADLEINFNEIVEAATGYINLYKTAGDELVQAFNVTSDISGSGTAIITINPTLDFESLTDYYVQIDATAFDDEAGNSYAGISDVTTWNFTSVDINDPAIFELSPDDNDEDVSVNTDLIITFNEPVYAQAGSYITIKESLGDAEFEQIEVTSTQVTGDETSIITVDLTSDFAGETGYYVLIDNTAFMDSESNYFAGIASTTLWNFTTEDVAPPTIVLPTTPADDAIDVVISSDLVITFNENVDKGSGNIIITNATTTSQHESIDVTTGQVTISSNVVTINPNTDFDGESNYYVEMASGVFEDVSTNANDFGGISGSTTWNFTTEDIIKPTISISTTENDPTSNSPFNIDIVFSEEVTGFTPLDISITNANVTNLTTTDNIEYVAEITPSVDGIITVNIAADAVTDLAGNGNIVADQFSIEYIFIPNPSVAISTTEPDTTNSSVFQITIAFSEEVTGFAIDDINVTNGVASNLNTTDNTDFTADITPTTDGVVSMVIPANSANNSGEYGNVESNTLTITYDITVPVVSVSTIESNPTNANPIPFTITFSEKVTGFVYTDITIANGSTSAISTIDNIEFTFNVIPDNDGDVTIDINAGVATDIAGNDNTAAATYTIEYDPTSPSVTITSSESGTVTGNFDVTITFTEVVTGFTSDDITVVNGSIIDSAEVTANTVWTMTIEPVTDGDVTVNISAGLAQDAAGNDNTAADQFSIYYDSGVGFEDMIPYEISIYSLENRVIVEFTNEGNYQFEKGIIEVYNLLGQKITGTNINDFVKFETKVEHVSQIYVVKVIIDGVPYTKRLYIE